MAKVDTMLGEIKGHSVLAESDLVKKLAEAVGVSPAAAPAFPGAHRIVLLHGFCVRRRGAASGEPRQRNSRTQIEAGTCYRTTGPFRASRSRVCNDPGQVVSQRGDVSFSVSLFLARKGCRLRSVRSRR